MATCVGCGAALAPAWNYCIHCGIAVDAQEIPAAIRPTGTTPPSRTKTANRLLLTGGITTFIIGVTLIILAIAYALGTLK